MSENTASPSITTSTSVNLNDVENYRPDLVLVAIDRQNQEHEGVNKGVSERQLLNLKTGTYQLWLRIENHQLCPSDGQILRETTELFFREEDMDLPRRLLGRKFDTEKAGEIILLFKSEGNSTNPIPHRMMARASAGNMFPLGSRKFEPGNCELELIGPINFRYVDQEGNLRILEEEQLNLKFWFQIDEKTEQDSSSGDSDASSHKGYYLEAEVE